MMKGRLTVIGTDFLETIYDLTEPPTEAMLQAAVGGGSFQEVPLFTQFDGAQCVAFCNEDGKLEGMIKNLMAQCLWEQSVGHTIPHDFLVGPVVIITGDAEMLASL